MAPYASGANYSIEITNEVATCRVWQRPDLTMAEGAQCAMEKIAHFTELARRAGVRGLIFDLSKAPPVVGPKTQEALAKMIETFELARRPISVVVGENPVQLMQLRRIVAHAASRFGRVCVSVEEATARMASAPQSRPRRP